MTNTGKHVIIIVNFILIAAFISRFYFDKILSDLNESIKVKSEILQQNADFEKRFNKLSNKLTTIKLLSINSTRPFQLLSEVISFMPEGVKLTNINFTGNNINFEANISSRETLNLLIQNLGSLDSVKNIDIASVIRKNGKDQTTNTRFVLNMKTSNNN